MKKKFLLFLLIACFSSTVFSQVTVNPTDNFYTLVESWQMREIVGSVPPLRPYPLNVVKEILNQVLLKGDSRDKDIAKYYWEQITGKKWYIELEGGVSLDVNESDSQKTNLSSLYEIFPSIQGDFGFRKDFVSMGYKIGFAARNEKNELKFLPKYTNSLHDAIQDPASFGPFYTYVDMNDVITLGTTHIFAQTGIYRTGYGSFLNEGLSLNDTSYHSANLSFTYLNDRLSYAHLVSIIGASNNYESQSSLSPDKFLAFHQFEYKFHKKFSASYYETIVFGNRFDPSYLLPVPFMAAQGLNGCNDNLQMGLAFRYRPINGFTMSSDIFVDNLDVENLLKLNFKTLNSLAVKAGLIYTPENSYCTRVDLNYTLVTPFTYSHYQFENDGSINASTVNYQNYTNSGINMGTSYEPNSDTINLTLDFIPVPGLNLRVKSTFMRHGNICENYSDDEAMFYLLSDPDVYATDGTINTTSKVYSAGNDEGKAVSTAVNNFNFLNQRHIMYLFQTGFNGKYTFGRIKNICDISLKFSYDFEFIHGNGVDSNIYPGGSVTEITDGSGNVTGWKIGEDLYYDKGDVVDYFNRLWASRLEDVINNYFTFGVSIKF